ncbi:MAG: phosphodiester glycosidase family protein [Clostridia bacterium]|nr:phosphodiester glycosidase family protein [Clostridia bacterium]
MKRFFLKPFRWAAVFSLLLIGSFTYVLLDTFVIPQSLEAATTVLASENADTSGVIAEFDASAQTSSEATITDNSYEDENIKISIETLQKYDSTIYVADIQVSDVSYLQTALANDTYGKNIKETTSDIASSHNAIFAVNGDYYGFRNSGYVLRNGNLYRDTADSSGDTEALVIDENGDFSIISERETAVSSLNTEDVWQIFSFGPALIEEGQIAVDSSSEVSQSKTNNPRTAIGQISELHYVIIVSDGRTSESEGLSLLELAQEFQERDCTTAYNLDGGGSSTMYFNGEVINNPTNGKNMGEREVSDIVYIGY